MVRLVFQLDRAPAAAADLGAARSGRRGARALGLRGSAARPDLGGGNAHGGSRARARRILRAQRLVPHPGPTARRAGASGARRASPRAGYGNDRGRAQRACRPHEARRRRGALDARWSTPAAHGGLEGERRADRREELRACATAPSAMDISPFSSSAIGS